jgi:integrase
MTEISVEPRRSTRQLLEKIPNYPGFYRHAINKTYYGIKKIAGKRKEHSLETNDRKIAERRLKEWIGGLDKIDSELEKTTLVELIDKFVKTRQGKAAKTKATEQWIIKKIKAEWEHGLDIRVSRVRPSMLDEWLAKQAGLRNSSYDRITLFLRQLFQLAMNDRMIAESPFARVQRGWKRPEKPLRRVPTDEQFKAIVNSVRSERHNASAEQSADFIEFMGLAGLGQAEASSLTWGDVHWDKQALAVRRRKTKVLFFPPIYPDLKPFLQKLLGRYPTPPDQHTPIFNVKDARKALTNACTRLCYPHFSQRSIRAFLIRKLWQARVDVKLIAKWQGHTDGGKLILSTYTEVFSSNDEAYISAELSKLAPVAAAVEPVNETGNISLSAAALVQLLAELKSLRAKVANP